MTETFRREIISETFFPSKVRTEEGVIVPAPEEAVEEYARTKNEWFTALPNLPHETPMVSLGPTVFNNQEGYSVRKIIIYT